jgi:hypothetical protein
LPNFRVWHHFRQWNILHKIWLIKYSVHTMSNKLQGNFFDWSPPSFSKYKFLYNLWNLEKIQASLHGNLYLKNLGGLQSKNHPVVKNKGFSNTERLGIFFRVATMFLKKFWSFLL